MTSCTYRFLSSSLIDLPTQSYELRIRQQPQRAKVSIINERDRRPIEPPPILQVRWLQSSPDDIKKNLQCPFYFMVANLLCGDSGELLSTQDYLAGSTVSSLYHLRDIDDTDGGFFVFGDLFCKKQGHYRLQFSLFEIVEGQVQNRQVITSEPFRTYMPKNYPGPVEATFLSRAFSDQGVKMRIRKEHRISSGTVRKRRMDVQALMDSQQEHTPLKTTKISMAAPHRLTSSADPPRIAPAITQYHVPQQSQSMVPEQQHNRHYHPPETMTLYHHHHPQAIVTNTTTSIDTHRLLSKDHVTEAAHAYPSPPLLPTRTCSTDTFSVTLLDEYHLQQHQPSAALSPSSSSSVSPSVRHNHPTTPPSSSSCFYPSDSDSPSLQHHVWGERLPALKAVMSGYTSRSAPLVLPCPFENI